MGGGAREGMANQFQRKSRRKEFGEKIGKDQKECMVEFPKTSGEK